MEHGLEFQRRNLQGSFILIQQRTHDVGPHWASDSWPTLADHHESQRPPLGEFLPETHIEVCMVEVREAHDEFSHLLNRGALLCHICQLVDPHLKLRQLLELCSHLICFGPDKYGKTGRLPFVAVDVPHWSACLQPREEVCSRFLANADDHRNKEMVLDGLCRCVPPLTHFDNMFLCRFQGKLFDAMRLKWMTRMAGRSLHQGRRWWLHCHWGLRLNRVYEALPKMLK